MPDLKQELLQLKYLDPKRKFALFALLIFLFVAGFSGAALLLRPKPQPQPTPIVTAPPPPSPTPKPTTSLFLNPAQKTLKKGESLPLEVIVDKVFPDALDVVLTFDPAVFTVSNLKKGTAFPAYHVLKWEAGRILISASLLPQEEQTATLPATLVSFTLTAQKATPSATINFAQKETIAAIAGEDVLGETMGGSYKVE